MPTLKGLLGNQQKIVKSLWDTFGNNPRNQETVDAMKGMLGLLPLGAGDVASGLLAADDVRRGDYTSAGLNGVGMLPYIPSMAGMISTKMGRIPENGKDTSKLLDMLYFAGDRKGYDITYDSSKISPSKYITFSSPDDPMKAESVRFSDHKDVNGSDAFKVDPHTYNTFEDAVRWLAYQGFPTDLSERYIKKYGIWK